MISTSLLLCAARYYFSYCHQRLLPWSCYRKQSKRKTSAHSHQERLLFLYAQNSDRPRIGLPQRSHRPFGEEPQSHWHRLSRQSQPQEKLAAWWCERVDSELQRRQILIRWQPPRVVRTEFSQLPPIYRR